MGNDYEIFSLSDQALTFSVGNQLNSGITGKLVAMKRWLIERNLPGVDDIIIAYSSLTICYRYFDIRQHTKNLSVTAFLKSILAEAYQEAEPMSAKSTHWEIPVCYGNEFGPDLVMVANEKKISVNDVINIHASGKYNVFMIGFLPGFPYLAETDSRIHVQRKETPRAVVEKGSVGLAGKQTGIYPLRSPGGWQIIGRTAMELFDAKQNPPVKFEICDTVSFVPIDASQFADMSLKNR
jgi:inhibitor of KinA